jgi:hypothetical protein
VFAALEQLAHCLRLGEHAVDEFGLLATAHPQVLGASTEQAAAVLDGDPAAVALGVDHDHARRPDRDVVDVAATGRHAPVVQEHHVVPGSPLSSLRASLTSPSAPRAHAL